MKLQISEMAKLTGVSVRTLHYYDDIGLLKPAETDEHTGYRFYDDTSIEKLKQILYYRELDFPLKEIPDLLEEKEFLKNRKLLERRKMLLDKKKQIEQLIETIDDDLAKPAELGGWFDKILRDYHYSGFSYKSSDEETFCVWGKADYEKDKPFALNSKYPIGFMTGQFIAVCALMLEEQGLLDTEAYIGDYLPECRYGNQVKIVHLLNMTSGISNQLSSERFSEKMNLFCQEAGGNLSEEQRCCIFNQVDALCVKKKSRDELMEIIDYAPLKFIPGEQFEYNGINYEILVSIMEQISGKSIADLLEETIFRPLEMQNTSYKGQPDVVGYAGDIPVTYTHDGCFSILTTPEDMTKWYEALLDRKLPSEKGYEKLFAPNEFDFAYGWYRIGEKYRFVCGISEVNSETEIDFEKGTYYFSARNKVPLPDNKDRLMYFTLKGCDDGQVRLEAWEMDRDTYVKIHSIKVYDKDAKELYSLVAPENKYLLYVENHGEKRLASEYIHDESYYLNLNLSKLLGEQFDSSATYIIEVRAEQGSWQASQIGVKYLHEGKVEDMGYYIFFNYGQAYDLFIEALGNVMEVV